MNASVELVKHVRIRITHIQGNSHKHAQHCGIVFSSKFHTSTLSHRWLISDSSVHRMHSEYDKLSFRKQMRSVRGGQATLLWRSGCRGSGLVAGTAAVIRLFSPICRHGTPWRSRRRMQIHFVAGSQVSILSGMWCEESEEETETAECGSVCLENRKVLFLMQLVVRVSGYWAPQELLEWNRNGPEAWPHFKG